MFVGRKLSRLLVISHVGLALLLAALLLVTGAGTIRAAIQERAQAQATQAATDALARLEDQRRDVAVVAGLLTERPTLQGYLQRNQRTAAGEFLDAFRQTARVDYILSAHDGEVFAEAGNAPPESHRSGLQVDPAGGFWLVEAKAMQMPAGTRVVVARRLSERTLTAGGDGDERIELLTVAGLSASSARIDDEDLRNAYAMSTRPGSPRPLPRWGTARCCGSNRYDRRRAGSRRCWRLRSHARWSPATPLAGWLHSHSAPWR